MPYLYTLFHESEQTGLPVVRPLVMEYSNDPETFQCSDEFLLGSQVLIAPILRPGKSHRSVYLPEGSWYDYWTGQKYEGGQYHLISADLDTLPLFVKAGTILPLGTPVQNTKENQEIELQIYYSEEDMIGYLYEDDGYSYNYREKEFSLSTFRIKEGQLNTEREGLFSQTASIKNMKIIGRD
jgi:alpha-glucosidase